jgi:hypothetical protein
MGGDGGPRLLFLPRRSADLPRLAVGAGAPQRACASREASFLLSIDAACAVLTFDVPPTQAPLTRGFLCAREWPTETVRGSQRPDCVAGVVDGVSGLVATVSGPLGGCASD